MSVNEFKARVKNRLLAIKYKQVNTECNSEVYSGYYFVNTYVTYESTLYLMRKSTCITFLNIILKNNKV